MHPSATLYTDQLTEVIADFIRKARTELWIAVCWLTHPDLYREIRARREAGVQVHLFVNFDHLNFSPEGLDFVALEAIGVHIWGFTGPGLLHHKCAWADGCRVLTGSCNWTRSTHCDHLLVFEDAKLTAQFRMLFEQLSRQCTPFAQLRGVTPRTISLQQLYRPIHWSPADIRRQIIGGARVWIVLFKSKDRALWERSLREQRYFLTQKSILQGFWQQQQHWDADAYRHWAIVQNSRLPPLTLTYCLQMHPGDVVVAVSGGQAWGIGIVGGDPEAAPGFSAARFVPWHSIAPGSAVDLDLPVRGPALRRYRGSGLRLADALGARLR